jgi:glycosyltransferase involved in cell wall biosynthesis
MKVKKNPFHMTILHVLTLNGRNGEYGGPVRVARELCTELDRRGHSTHIFSGALSESQPVAKPGLIESYEIVEPIVRRLAVSSLWSWKIIKPLDELIQKSDIVHIHFARDLIPFLTAILSIFRGKPFVTQTHGMILSDDRLSTRILDFLITKPLINKSRTNFVLTDIELKSIQRLEVKSLTTILPNGISVELDPVKNDLASNRVVFCSRLEKRKGIDKFIALADSYRRSGIKFEIYGPDNGELAFVKQELISRKLSESVVYKGALQAQEVQNLLSKVDLLVLPSKNEPFPMVVLEALAVGTPVLVMPSCGFADILKKFEPSFVANSEDFLGLSGSFEKRLASRNLSKSREEIIDFCNQEFGISSVTDQLLLGYKEAVSARQ